MEKADSITFKYQEDAQQRNTELQGGQFDIIHQAGPLESQALKTLGGGIHLLTMKPGNREIAHYWLISKKPPFNSQAARTAFATAIDRKQIVAIRANNYFQAANGFSDFLAPGYVANAGYPAFNLKKAQALVQQVKAQNGGQFNITLGSGTDSDVQKEAALMKEQLGKAGINATITVQDQGTLIADAVVGSIDVLLWRNLYGGYTNLEDSDTYVWMANANQGFLTNFGNYNDDQIQALLDQGRAAKTTAEAKPIYQKLNQVMAQKGYMLPTWYISWTIAYQSNVHLDFPPLPDGNGKPLFNYGRIPLIGLSKG